MKLPSLIAAKKPPGFRRLHSGEGRCSTSCADAALKRLTGLGRCRYPALAGRRSAGGMRLGIPLVFFPGGVWIVHPKGLRHAESCPVFAATVHF